MSDRPAWVNEERPCVGCALATDHDVQSNENNKAPVRYWFCAWKPKGPLPFWVDTEPRLVGPYGEGGCAARVERTL